MTPILYANADRQQVFNPRKRKCATKERISERTDYRVLSSDTRIFVLRLVCVCEACRTLASEVFTRAATSSPVRRCRAGSAKLLADRLSRIARHLQVTTTSYGESAAGSFSFNRTLPVGDPG